jgi:kynurenine formamidase
MNAVEFILEHKVKLLGIDTMGMDPYTKTGFDVHHALLKKGIPFIEDLCNLDRLSERNT